VSSQPPGTNHSQRSERVLVLAPTPGDAELCRRFLSDAAIDAEIHDDGDAFCAAVARPAGALVIAEEVLHDETGRRIRDALGEQEAWSTLPVLVLAGSPRRASSELMADYESYGRVIFLERPVRIASFLTSVKMALVERRQQYRIRDLLEERNTRIEQRDEFLATLGHELRNPLAAIMTCAELLEMGPSDASQARRAREIIATQANQLKRLLDDVVDVSRITRRKLLLQPEPVDLRRVLEDVGTQVETEIRGKRQRLSMDVEEAEIPLIADPMRLRQVFANLLRNASRYSDDGGYIAVSARRRGTQAVVCIRDEGIGMTQQTIARIFDPFFQCQDNGNGSREGLGVGLALARSLVERHAGSIAAYSEGLGGGSQFEIVLPMAPALPTPVAADDTETRTACAETPHRRILLIDDNVDFALGLQSLLGNMGYDVHLAHDGTEGLRAAQRLAPDVVLLDIGLPGLDGYEVARRLRRLKTATRPRMIAVTGYRRDNDKRRCRLAGIDGYLIKPIDLSELQAEIARH
jgi:signal transduction histidine kinase